MKTGVVCDGRYADHDMGAYHVESPQRILALNRMLETAPPAPFLPIEPRQASEAELEWVHERGYVAFVRSTAGRKRVVLDPDTSAGPKTYETARLAAGGVMSAVDSVMEGRVANALALVRPPGHHAEAGYGKGFCIFNNVAVGAEYLVRRRGMKRVLVADFDVHHGNGTQHHFYDRDDVLYFSTHRVPFYPGTGRASEIGQGPGRGFNLNVPLTTAGVGDAEYIFLYGKVLAAVASRYRPEFILVSSGFDIGAGDPLGGMSVSGAGFGALAAAFRSMAEAACGGRLVYVLEGGYNLRTLLEGVGETLMALSAEAPSPAAEAAATPSEAFLRQIEPSLRIFGEFWPVSS
jgi:acetoin utilization deacetylase AcuC-like enzyme